MKFLRDYFSSVYFKNVPHFISLSIHCLYLVASVLAFSNSHYLYFLLLKQQNMPRSSRYDKLYEDTFLIFKRIEEYCGTSVSQSE